MEAWTAKTREGKSRGVYGASAKVIDTPTLAAATLSRAPTLLEQTVEGPPASSGLSLSSDEITQLQAETIALRTDLLIADQSNEETLSQRAHSSRGFIMDRPVHTSSSIKDQKAYGPVQPIMD